MTREPHHQRSEGVRLPSVSVVIVSDYEADSAKTWANEQAALEALGRQDFAEPLEVIVVEHEAFRDSVPVDLVRSFAGGRVEFSAATASAELKDEGAKLAKGQLVAVLEADCAPAADWLRRMVSTLREHPECAAVSGKTLYPGRSVLTRCLALLDRSYLDPGGSGPTPSVCNNNAMFRREALVAHPYPAAPSPFLSAAFRGQRMRRSGLRFFFESRAVVYHALPSWSFVREMRRHSGFSVSVQLNGGLGTVIRALVWRLYGDVRRGWRLRRHYGVRWYEMPAVWGLALAARLFEAQGAAYARRGYRGVPGTAYR